MDQIPWDQVANIANVVISIVGIVGIPLFAFILRKFLFPKWEREKREKFVSSLLKIYEVVEAIAAKTAWKGDDKLAAAIKALGESLTVEEIEIAKKFFAGQAVLSKKKQVL